ncbi:MAG: hypothetical protein JST59_00400 [Actinobacteria bacterium]|nr:hypothetical protein [Actinomycetota bacterium]
MGNLRKNKKDSTRIEKSPISSGGELSDKELEMLKGMIQNICQNSTPLGKSIEFVNDDIESMNSELLSWRKQYNVRQWRCRIRRSRCRTNSRSLRTRWCRCTTSWPKSTSKLRTKRGRSRT